MATTSSTLPVDMELKKAFQELQAKMIDTAQKLKVADMQIEGLKRNIQHSRLTDQEISLLPPSTRTYEGVGRMFILTEIGDVRNNLDKKIHNAEEKIKHLEGNKTYLERSIKDSEDNLRELVSTKQGK